MPIQHKFYINLLDDHERRQKFMGKGYHRWEAVSREEVPDEIDKKKILHLIEQKSLIIRG